MFLLLVDELFLQGREILFSDIVVIIFHGILYRFTYSFKGRKMNDAGNVAVFLKYGAGIVKVAEVYFVVFYFLPGDLFNRCQQEGRASAVVIY